MRKTEYGAGKKSTQDPILWLCTNNRVVFCLKLIFLFRKTTILSPLSVVEDRHCSDPGAPLNGYRKVMEETDALMNGRYAKIGTTIAFFCNNSYTLSGNKERTCQESGEWTGKQPICIKGSLHSLYYLKSDIIF